MKKNKQGQVLLGFALIALILIGAGCAKEKPDVGKIPVTTASEEAKKEFLQGRDLADRLLQYNSIQHYEAAVAKDPNFALAHFALAQVSPTAKAYFDHMKKATTLAEKASEAERLLILGTEAGVNGDAAKQKEYFEKLVSLCPNDQRAHFALGNYYNGQQEYAKAVEHYKKATAIDSSFSPAYNTLGYTYRAMENYAESERAFKKYMELIPNDPNPPDSYAELLMKMGRFDESIVQYEKALALDPNFISSHLGIAGDLMFKGKPDEAAARLQKVLDMARNDGERRTAMLSKSVLYVDGGKLDMALQELDRQYAISEKDNDVAQMATDLGLKGDVLYEMGKYDDAKALYDRSAKLVQESDLPAAIKENVRLNQHYSATLVAMKKKDLKTAAAEAGEFRKGATSMQNQALIRQAHELDGITALEQKQYDKALAELQQANQLSPYNLFRISLAYAGKGDKANAKEFCMKAARSNVLPTFDYAFIRAKAEKMLAKM